MSPVIRKAPGGEPQLPPPPAIPVNVETLKIPSQQGAMSPEATPAQDPPIAQRARLDEVMFAPDPRNHRSGKPDPDLEDLAVRMRKLGQLQPVLAVTASLYREMYPHAAVNLSEEQRERFERADLIVIIGNRRLEAAILAGLDELLYILNDDLLAAEDYREAALDENLRRLNLTCVEVARTLAEFVAEDGSTTHAALAERVGRSRTWVTQHLAVVALPVEVQDYIDVKRLSLKQAYHFTQLSAEKVAELVEQLRKTAADGSELVASPAVTRATKRPPEPKVAKEMLARYRAHRGAGEFAALVCKDLDAEAAATLAVSVVEQLDEEGIAQVEKLLASRSAQVRS